MPERSVYLEGSNLGLVAAIVLFVGCAAVVAVGPASSELDRLQAQLLETRDRLETWNAESSGFAPVRESQSAAWRSRWLALVQRSRSIRGDAELMALVADGLSADSTRGLNVVRQPRPADLSGEEDAGAFALQPIGDGDPLSARPEHVRATLTASYEDARLLVARFDSHETSARLEAIELKRYFPDVALEFDLVYIVRTEPTR